MTYELEEIKKIRKKLGLTQTELANRSGVSQSLIAKIEAGRIDPTYTKTKKIFAALSDLEKKEEIKAEQLMTAKIIGVAPADSTKEAITIEVRTTRTMSRKNQNKNTTKATKTARTIVPVVIEICLT